MEECLLNGRVYAHTCVRVCVNPCQTGQASFEKKGNLRWILWRDASAQKRTVRQLISTCLTFAQFTAIGFAAFDNVLCCPFCESGRYHTSSTTFEVEIWRRSKETL